MRLSRTLEGSVTRIGLVVAHDTIRNEVSAGSPGGHSCLQTASVQLAEGFFVNLEFLFLCVLFHGQQLCRDRSKFMTYQKNRYNLSAYRHLWGQKAPFNIEPGCLCPM